MSQKEKEREHYGIGYVLRIDDMLATFPYYKLNFSLWEMFHKKDKQIAHVFATHMRMVIEDLIRTNGTFNLPIGSSRRGTLRIEAMPDETFKLLRSFGLFRDTDIFATDCKGYCPVLKCYRGGKERAKMIFIPKYYFDLITKKANEGFPFGGGGKDDFYMEDYVERLKKEFPNASKRDFITIMRYCWRSIFARVFEGCDIFIKRRGFGALIADFTQHIRYIDRYQRKMYKKIRSLYKDINRPYDGYRYFFANPRIYFEHGKELMGDEGYLFDHVNLYKTYDMAVAWSYNSGFIFRVKMDNEYPYRMRMIDYRICNAELVRKGWRKSDCNVLLISNEYKTIKKVKKLRNGEREYLSKPVEAYTESGKVYGPYYSMYEAARQTGAKRPNIYNAIHGKRNYAGKIDGEKLFWRFSKKMAKINYEKISDD